MPRTARCIVEDPKSGPTAFDVAEVDVQGVTLRTPKLYEKNLFLDVILELSGSQRVPLFAQVAAENNGGGLKLRWMHVDAGEETALTDLLASWQAGEFEEVKILADESHAADVLPSSVGSDNATALNIFGNGLPQGSSSERSSTRRISRPDIKPADNAGVVDLSTPAKTQAEIYRHKTVALDMNLAPSDYKAQLQKSDQKSDENKPEENKVKTVRFDESPVASRVVAGGIVDAVGDNDPAVAKNSTRKIVRPQSQGERDQDAVHFETKRETRRIVQPGEAKAAVTPELKPQTQSEIKPKSSASGRPTAQVASEPVASLTPIRSRTVGETAHDTVGDDSSAHNVVVTNTRRFKSITDGKNGGTQSLTKRQNVLSEDGKLDVGASIRNSAKTVSASELAERHDKLKVLNMRTIKTLIQDAVAEALEQLGGALNAKEKERLLKEAEDSFKDRLESFQAEKKGMEAQSQRLREQLDRAQELLEEEKKRKIEKDQFTVSDTGIANLEKQFERMVSKASKSGGLDNEFEANLRTLVNNLLDDERSLIAEQARKAQDESIQLLERKVQRLAGSLQDTEKERDAARRHANELAQSGGGGGSVQNMYDVGLADSDANKEAKLALLKDIFAQNQEMREHMAKTGVTVEGRKRAPRPAQAAAAAKPGAASKPAVVVAASAEKAAEAPETTETLGGAPAATAATAAAPANAPASAASDDESTEMGGAELSDPDDLPWQPGQTNNIEAELDDDEEGDSSGSVKKIVIAAVEPPKLQRKSKPVAPADADADANTNTDANTAEAVASSNPDDMPWEPAAASDAADAEEASSGVKKITIKADFEPPPLKRKQ